MTTLILILLAIFYGLPLIVMVIGNLIKRRFVLQRLSLIETTGSYLDLKLTIGLAVSVAKRESKWYIYITIGMIDFSFPLN